MKKNSSFAYGSNATKQVVAGSTKVNLGSNARTNGANNRSYIKKVKITLNGEQTTIEVDLRQEPDLWWLECKAHLTEKGFDVRWESFYLEMAESIIQAMLDASFNQWLDGGDFGDVLADIHYFIGVVNHASRWDYTLKKTVKKGLEGYLKGALKNDLRRKFRKAQNELYV